MSLLMKALEKAAKDREETAAPPKAAAPVASTAPPAAGGMSELKLEPLASAAPSREAAPPSARRETAASTAAPARDAAQAATVLRAGRREPGGIGVYVRERPVVAFGMLAALFLAGYGTYVYLQVTNPGLFIRQAPRPAQTVSSAPIAQSPATAGTMTPAQPQIALTPLLPPLQEGAEKAAVQPTAPAPAAPAVPAVPVPPVAAPPAPAARHMIKVTRGGAEPVVNPLLAGAYAALNAGDFESAQRLYDRMLRIEPNNIDALLGLAAAAAQQGDSEQASRHYLKVLELEPRHALAQAGLIGMLGRADPLAAETRLKQLIAREPSPYLYFTLGNLHADRSQWAQAQQAYSQAYHLQPDNPDYAYNLAIGLEHLAQPKLALEFYQRATQLAATKGRVNFSIAAAQERISKLEKVVK